MKWEQWPAVALVAAIAVAVVFGIWPECVRIRQALERAWPSNAVIDARETR